MSNLNSKAEKCLFCGKPKTYWKSEIVLFIGGRSYMVTVCPEDRKIHTIQELYVEASNQAMREMQKVMAQYDIQRKKYADEVLESLDLEKQTNANQNSSELGEKGK